MQVVLGKASPDAFIALFMIKVLSVLLTIDVLAKLN